MLCSGMRAFLATGLLVLQLRPMLGMVLCQALSGGDGDRLAMDCPMPKARPADGAAPGGYAVGSPASGPNTGSTLTLPGDGPRCGLAEFCLTTPPAISPAHHALIRAPLDSRLGIGPSVDLHRAQIRTPPVPPPKV